MKINHVIRRIRWKSKRSPLVYFKRTECWVARADDLYIGPKLFVRGEFEFSNFIFALKQLGREDVDVLYDIGANIGPILIPAVSRELAARAVAFEPEAVNFALLLLNVSLNQLGASVVSHAVALSDVEVEGELALDSNNFGDFRVQRHPKGKSELKSKLHPALLRRFDQFAFELNPSRDLLWIDVQGHELEVLRGMGRQLESGTPIVLELWPDVLEEHSDVDDFLSLLAPYSHFVDLPKRGDRRPLCELRELWSQLRGNGSTDCLFLKVAP